MDYNKEFKIPNSHEWYNISRALYEGLPCSMVACCWTDKRMEELAELIGKHFQMAYPPSDFSYQSQAEQIENEFYMVIEECAIAMGMRYYEDLSDQAYNKLTEWCKNNL